jgi:hypothetical protein
MVVSYFLPVVALRPFNGWSKSKSELDELSGVTAWTLHDLRRIFATRLAEMAVAPHVTERVLSHIMGTVSGVDAVYSRATHMAEMRGVMELWERYLEEKIICRRAPAIGVFHFGQRILKCEFSPLNGFSLF